MHMLFWKQEVFQNNLRQRAFIDQELLESHFVLRFRDALEQTCTKHLAVGLGFRRVIMMHCKNLIKNGSGLALCYCHITLRCLLFNFTSTKFWIQTISTITPGKRIQSYSNELQNIFIAQFSCGPDIHFPKHCDIIYIWPLLTTCNISTPFPENLNTTVDRSEATT